MEEKRPDKATGNPVAEPKAAAPDQGIEAPAGKEEKAPAPAGKVIDITGAGAGKDKSGPAKADQPDKDKGGPAKADKPDKDKDGPAKAGKPDKGKGGPAKTDKPDKGKSGPGKADKPAKDKAQAAKDGKGRDKLSQGDKAKGGGKTADKPPKGKAPAEPPKEEPKEPPRPVEKGKLVYLKLSEVHPFHTFRPHPFQVRKDAAMRDLAESIKENGVMTPGTVRPEKDGKPIIAGTMERPGRL